MTVAGTRLAGSWALIVGLLLGAFSATARQRDPLTQDEIDQLREVALEPEKRLKLLAEFAGARLTTIEKVRGQEKSDENSPQAIHDLIEDFLAVYDELDDNIAMYADRQSDLRKALKPVLLADGDFHARLEGLQHNLTAEERTECDFAMRSAVDAITSSTIEHKKLLAEQNASPPKKK
jgi:molecular chaperone GrpE (heat shock protein)